MIKHIVVVAIGLAVIVALADARSTVSETVSLKVVSNVKGPVATKEGTLDGLIFYCTLDHEKAIVSPAIAPAGTFMTERFAEGKCGKVLWVMQFTKHVAIEYDLWRNCHYIRSDTWGWNIAKPPFLIDESKTRTTQRRTSLS